MRPGERIPLQPPLLFWLLEYASEILKHCKVQTRGGTTTSERQIGNVDTVALADFGEVVRCMPLGASRYEDRARRLNKAEPRLGMGVHLGLERDVCDYRIGTESGAVVKAVTLRRLPVTHQWQPALVKKSTSYPGNPSGRISRDGPGEGQH